MPNTNQGEILLPGELRMLRRLGEVTGPNGKYEILVDPNSQPCVKSLQTNRKFLLSWEFIVEMAVDNGIDDKGERV